MKNVEYEKVLADINCVLDGYDPCKMVEADEADVLNSYDAQVQVLMNICREVDDDILTEAEVLETDPERIADLLAEVSDKIMGKITK